VDSVASAVNAEAGGKHILRCFLVYVLQFHPEKGKEQGQCRVQ
jgi:hypothetical protein